jgi:hypothetical protein
MAVAVAGYPGSREAAILMDLDEGLERIPESYFQVLELRGLRGLANQEAAEVLGVSPNTMSRRYNGGVRWLIDYLHDPKTSAPVRQLDWREWALTNVQEVLEGLELKRPPGPGRPPTISSEIDERVLRLHCAGSSERAIAERLNDEYPRGDETPWTRSSVRSVLNRYAAPRRPRGRRRTPGTYRPGDITRPDYLEIEVGRDFCEPDALLERGR